MPLDKPELKSAIFWYRGILIRTLQPDIVAGFALTRGGSIKFKDSDKIYKLLQTTKTKIPIKFIDFARDIKATYPNEYQDFLLKEFLLFPLVPTVKKCYEGLSVKSIFVEPSLKKLYAPGTPCNKRSS